MSRHREQTQSSYPPEILAAAAQRMNKLNFVRWDRCVLHPGSGVAYGWISRDDGRNDFIVMDFSWGETEGLDGAEVTWFAIGFTTSSAVYSAIINKLIRGDDAPHKDCERVEDVFGALVDWKVIAA